MKNITLMIGLFVLGLPQYSYAGLFCSDQDEDATVDVGDTVCCYKDTCTESLFGICFAPDRTVKVSNIDSACSNAQKIALSETRIGCASPACIRNVTLREEKRDPSGKSCTYHYKVSCSCASEPEPDSEINLEQSPKLPAK